LAVLFLFFETQSLFQDEHDGVSDRVQFLFYFLNPETGYDFGGAHLSAWLLMKQKATSIKLMSGFLFMLADVGVAWVY